MSLFKSIKYFIQRGKRGYADSDLWDFDAYLCGMIPPALRKLKEKKVGCPAEFYNSEIVNDECRAWTEALEAMAQGFEAAEYVSNHRYYKHIDSGKNGYRVELDNKAMDNAVKKMDLGLKLFAENFINLWD